MAREGRWVGALPSVTDFRPRRRRPSAVGRSSSLTDRPVLAVSANHRLFITARYSLFAWISLPLISHRPIVRRSAPVECPLIGLLR